MASSLAGRILCLFGLLAATVSTLAAAEEPLVEKIYLSEERGAAGKWPGKTEYDFEIQDLPRQAALLFWAAGDFGTDSHGDVYLVTPDGKRQKVAAWTRANFDKPAVKAGSYKDLNPISADVSALVTRPGPYKVQFEFREGKYQLDILRVELRVRTPVPMSRLPDRDRDRHGDRDHDEDRGRRNTRAYQSEQAGVAGCLADSGNIYTFVVEAPGERTELALWAQAGTVPGTAGDVWLQNPAGERQVVYQWKESDFLASGRHGDPRERAPLVLDVSQLVRQAGPYKVLFLHRLGTGQLNILRVRLAVSGPGLQSAGTTEFRVINADPVMGNPRQATAFRLETEAVVTYIETRHLPGVRPGRIALRHADGTVYGPWNAAGAPATAGTDGRFTLGWCALPQQRVKPGDYTVIDSDPATWACNTRSGLVGFAVINFAGVADRR